MSLAIPGTVAASTAMGSRIKLATLNVQNTTTRDLIFSIGNIPQTFQDLEIVMNGRSSTSATTDQIGIYLNFFGNPAGGLFSTVNITGPGTNTPTSTRSSGQSICLIGNVPGATTTSTIFGSCMIYLPNYRNTNLYKLIHARSSCDLNGAGNVSISMGLGKVPDQTLTQIVIFPLAAGAVWAVNTTASLYGVRSVGQ